MESTNQPNGEDVSAPVNPPATILPPPATAVAGPQSKPIAPMWHTIALIFVILTVSMLGFQRHAEQGTVVVNRMHTYGVTAVLELALAGWVVLGLRLRRVPLRSLLGRAPNNLRSIASDAAIALVFWIGSLMALMTIAMIWVSIESLVTHRPIPIQTSKDGQPTISKEDKAARAVVQLAPANGKEMTCWLLLCVLVGFAEELVFRGYFQTQFTAWGHGAVAAGVVFSALLFGAAHGYEGVRAMFLLSVFGAFFSGLALVRRRLRVCMFAHTLHDAVAGLLVAYLHARHVV